MSARDADMGAVYAQALAEAAEAKGLLVEAGAELAAFAASWRKDASVRAFFLSGAIPRPAKEGAVETSFRGKASDVFVDFLRVLLARNRTWLVPEAADAYGKLLDERLGRVHVTITTAAPVTPTDLQALGQKVKAATGLEPVVEHRVRPALVGGAVVRVGDFVADGSVRRHLKEIEARLRQAGRVAIATAST